MNVYVTKSLNNTEMQSSSDMIDIQIEESLVRETLMYIDSANFNEDLITLLSFFAILFISVLIGIFGEPAITSQDNMKSISSNTAVEQFSSSSTILNPYHRFISFSLKLTPKNPNVQNYFSFNYKVDCKNDLNIIRSTDKSYDMVPINSKDDFIFLYTDRIIDFNAISIQLNLQNASNSFSDFILRTEIGVSSYSTFQIFFRFIFSIIQFLFVVMICMRLSTMSIKIWHLEQKLTVPLLLLAILYDNPFYYFRIVCPSHFFIILDTIVDVAFSSYFHFFLLVLFDSLRFKNRKTDRCFFIPKLIFLAVHLLTSLSCSLYSDIQSFNETLSLFSDPLRIHIQFPYFFIEMIYFGWLIYSISNASCKVDVTERYKFNMYFATGCISFIISFTIEILSYFQINQFFRYSMIHFITIFAVKNVYTLLMAFFHWPYEFLQDRQYVDSADDLSSVVPGDFFVNIDSDE
ncbi:hypothetical protein TRFO_18142 [Tritrichomonas foetus]|uniref:Wntless-like transmembrane domain-containing protein n=1 Tax=Tritrichomonas foetus TaxID=1144522 RepID=A0A1J4KLG8_9EUKA|nr:hypothetical protein TRFO_18142 [Tritrichomonas foetus]|eukprot:OHT12151.1 hypothetical protein TRFO_18142 [Tritrichomonas foetus]